LVEELIRWEKCQKNMIEGIAKKKNQKICVPLCQCPRSSISKVVSCRRSKTIGEEANKTPIGG
jgi:hypothetical protein